ncbi:MAG: hypothetical protein WD768_11365 [Phycisphaeraceae bacterium]
MKTTPASSRLLPVLLLLAMTAGAVGDDAVVLLPQLKAGDTLTLVMTKSLGEVRNGKPVPSKSTVSTLEGTVLSIKESAIVMRWKITEIKLPDDAGSNHPVTKALAKIAQEIVAEVRFDWQSREASLENFDQVKEKIDEALELAITLYGKEAKWDDEKMASARKVIKTIATRETVETLMLNDFKGYMTLLGTTLSRTKTTTLEIQATVPPLGFKVPATLQWSPASAGDDATQVNANAKQDVDTETMRKAHLEFLKAQAANLNRPAPDEDTVRKVKLDKTIRASLDVKRGIPLHVKQTEMTTDFWGSGEYWSLEYVLK